MALCSTLCVLAPAVGLVVLSGDQVAVYSELCYRTALHGVAFHPHENMVAFCAYGQSQPIHVYLYDRKGLWKHLNRSSVCSDPSSVSSDCVMLYHAVSQLEMHNVKAASTVSRAASVDTKTIRNTPDPPALQDTSSALALDQFAQATRLSLKMQYVKEQLDSALVSIHPLLLYHNYT